MYSFLFSCLLLFIMFSPSISFAQSSVFCRVLGTCNQIKATTDIQDVITYYKDTTPAERREIIRNYLAEKRAAEANGTTPPEYPFFTSRKQKTEEPKPITPEQRQTNQTISEETSPAFQRAAERAQRTPPPEYNNSVLNQSGVKKPFDGKSSCNKDGGGTLSGKDKPKNQGGPIEDELFYAAANAAKASGAKVTIISGHRPGATVKGTGKTSMHASGKALDVNIDGPLDAKTRFIVLFIANTKDYNSVGSYAGTKNKHTHLGADCGASWCPFKDKGARIEDWKKFAFDIIFENSFNESARPPKAEVHEKAKRAAQKVCSGIGTSNI